MNKLKIGIVCYPSYGGSGVVATELGMTLADMGHCIHFISYETPFRLVGYKKNVHFHEVDMQAYPLFKYPLYSLALSSKIVEVCEADKLDILHVHYAIPHSICAYLSKNMMPDHDIKVITTLHGTDITLVGQEKSFYRLVQFGIMESDAVTSVSHYLKETTIKEFQIDKDIHVIPNFIDPEKFSPEKKNPKCLFVEDDEKMIVHISNFRPVKNIDVIMKVFSEIRKSVKSKLVLIGDGPEIPRARQLAKELDICQYVTFPGKVEQVEYILPCADLYLMPSRLESFGLAILEAMSCGVPTISSNVGGIPEVVSEGKTGYTFDPDDVNGMAQKSIEILTDDKLHSELKKNGREYAIKRFKQDHVVKMYENLYYKMLT